VLPASVELPAGAGKTQLLAATVRYLTMEGARVLVLTHTNAGVHAIQSRLRSFDASHNCTVSTITSFAFMIARPYPVLAELQVPPVPDWGDSRKYISAASRVATSRHIQAVLKASFTHLLVDEYQDCSREQHTFVCALTSAIPATGVVGDRMQAIFGFADPLVAWSDVQASFGDHSVPRFPWRWKGHNEQLGDWLLGIRRDLRPGAVLDLSSAALPVGMKFHRTNAQNRIAILNKYRYFPWPPSESVLILAGRMPEQTRSVAARLGGRFTTMEEIGGSFMRERLDDLASRCAKTYAEWLAATIKKCAVGAAGLDASVLTKLALGNSVAHLKRKDLEPVLHALDLVLREQTLESVATAMDTVRNVPSIKLHSSEAWNDINAAIRGTVAAGGQADTLVGELSKVRDRIRHAGRLNRRRIVSRTLLVKGLEYDHVVIADIGDIADQFNLYVALTRARRTVTILGAEDHLQVTETPMEPLKRRPRSPGASSR
jgi:hypothetical protein